MYMGGCGWLVTTKRLQGISFSIPHLKGGNFGRVSIEWISGSKEPVHLRYGKVEVEGMLVMNGHIVTIRTSESVFSFG